jgi:tRNA A22 N-methylase
MAGAPNSPIVEFIDDVREQHPDDQIVVLIPVIMPDTLRHRLLHNQIDLVLSNALRTRTDIVVARVTTPLEPESSEAGADAKQPGA